MTSPADGPRRVFLHVGSPKTGTTFLQEVLWSQRALAAEQGLLLPLERFFDHYLASLDVRGQAHRPEHPGRAVGIWKRLVAAAEAWPGTVLVSHELFASATAAQCQAALAAFSPSTELHVVITARDLVRQIPAEWQEHVKHRSTDSLPAFVAHLRREDRKPSWFWQVQDFANVAQRWGAALPPERVHVVTVPPVGADPDALWTRFATLLGLDPDAFDIQRGRSNSSLRLEQAELLRRVNAELGDRLPLPGPYARVGKNILAHRILAGRAGTPLSLSSADRVFAARRSADIADRLAASGVDIVGDLADLVPADDDPPVASGGYVEPSEEQVTAEAVAALASLLTIFANRTEHHQHDLDRLAALKRSPLRAAMVEASRQRPVLARAWRGYQKVRALSRGQGGPRLSR